MYESIGIKIAIDGGTELQRKVVEVALNYQDYEAVLKGGAKVPIVLSKHMCQKWVSDVYSAAGANEYSISRATATLTGEAWGVSSDWDKVPLGACVWGNCNDAGHVGIYAGNGQIVNAINERMGIGMSSLNARTVITVRRIF